MANRKIGVAVHLLLDASGSMEHTDSQSGPERIVLAREGANLLIKKLAEVANAPILTVTAFGIGGLFTDLVTERPVYLLPQITEDEYFACGGTPLVECISKAVDRLNSTDAERKVIIILTDGEDGDYWHGMPKLAPKIAKALEEGWLILFLGIGSKAQEWGGNLTIPMSHVLRCDRDLVGSMDKAAEAVVRFGAGAKIEETAIA